MPIDTVDAAADPDELLPGTDGQADRLDWIAVQPLATSFEHRGT